jgi:high affinity Mn2+ porin
LCIVLFAAESRAEDAPAEEQPAPSWYTLHFQQTTVTQGHPSFHAPYSGTNSLSPDGETETSITSTLFAGVALWPGASFYVNPELSGGSGVSSARGVAGFPNGEAFRIGDPTPIISPARIFLRQTISFGEQSEAVADDANVVASRRSPERLTITAGKFGIADIFDNNRYTHDPRSQFMNWALMNSGAWDYPADTRGYTWGVSVEYARAEFAVRAAAVLVPKDANGLTMDTRVDKAHGFALEGEVPAHFLPFPGTVRLLLFLNEARMGDYDQAIADNSMAPDVTTTRKYGRTKYGFALGLEQQLSRYVGGFLRTSWNDGRNETWAFAEIDASVAGGMVQQGEPWSREGDEFGVAAVLNALSGPHKRYLAAGGYGFMIGDGALSYATETILEAYYKLRVASYLTFTGDYQYVTNPAYNRDRGPVHVFALRTHVEL